MQQHGGAHTRRGAKPDEWSAGWIFWGGSSRGQNRPPNLVGDAASVERRDRTVRDMQARQTRFDMCGRRGEARKANVWAGALA